MAQLLNRCDPPSESCRSPIYPFFNSGISLRQVPLCAGPASSCDDCATPSTGRARIAAGGTLDRSHWIESWIYTQLTTRGEVDCHTSPRGRREGGWWMDSFRQGGAFKSGSKLWSLQSNRVTNEALLHAKAYASEALAYLRAWGIAEKIKVEASYVSQRVIRLAVTVTGPGGMQGTVTINGLALPGSGWMWSKSDGG